jgi:hypothetical protein
VNAQLRAFLPEVNSFHRKEMENCAQTARAQFQGLRFFLQNELSNCALISPGRKRRKK